MKAGKGTEGFFEKAFRSIPEPAMLISMEGVILYVSDSLVQTYGFSKEYFVGKNFMELESLSDSAKQVCRERLAKRINGDDLPYYGLLSLDNGGNDRYSEISSVPMEYEGKKVVLALVRDVTERKRMEEQLARADVAVDSMLDAVIVVDLEGRIVDINRAVTEIAGYSRDEMIGEMPFKFIAEKEHARFVEDMTRLLAGEVVEAEEYLALCKDGTELIISVNASVVRDVEGNPRAVVTVSRDITARKQAEEQLARSSVILEAMSDGVSIIDLEGRTVDINRAVTEMSGYSREELIGESALNFIAERDQPRLFEAMTRLLVGEVIEHIEVVCVRKDGTEFIAGVSNSDVRDIEGNITAIVSVIRDITERKQAEEKLRESEDKYRNVVERASDGIVIIQDGIIKYVNPRVREMTGYTTEKGPDISFLDFVHPDEISKMAERYERRMAGEDIEHTYETMLRHKNGNRIYVEVNAGIVTYLGQPANLAIVRDITERKEAEEKLVRSAVILEAMSDGVSIVDLEGRIIDVNRAVTEMSGYSREELIGGTAFKFMAEREQSRLFESMPRLLAGETIEAMEYEFIRKDGSTFIASAGMSPVRDTEGNLTAIVSVTRDVTERKRAEDALRKSEEDMRNLKEFNEVIVHNAPIGILRTDMRGRIVFVNPKVSDILGLSSEELVHTIIWKVPAILKAAKDAGFETKRGKDFKSVASSLPSDGLQLSVPFISTNGKTCQTLAHVVPIFNMSEDFDGILCLIEDVTERKEAQERLEESERLYAAMATTSQIGISIIQDGKFVYANQLFQANVGRTEEELLGLESLSVVHPDDREGVRKKAIAALKGESSVAYEYRIVRKSGEVRITLETVTPIQYYGKRASLVHHMDVTERKQSEEALRQRDEQLRQSQKMEAIGLLAGGIAHDFNNMLTPILGYTDLMLDGFSEQDHQYSWIEQIGKSAQRAASLTQQLLAFSRRQVLQQKVLNLNTPLVNTEQMLKRLIGEDIELVTTIDPALELVEVDPGQIEQVIMNLALNARDAMPDGGRLTFATDNVTLDNDHFRISREARPGRFVRLSIADTGIGMDDETIRRIFEPFFTTKGLGIGTGLGLSVAYGIVEQHKGWMEVHSTPGQGSIFEIYLPAYSGKRVGDDEEDSVPEDMESANNESILLVEDEDLVRDFTAKALRERGYAVSEAASAEEALKIFTGNEKSFDMVFSDVVLPGASGIILVDELLSIKPDLRVLLSSGYADQKSQWAVIKKRGFHFLEKPYTLPVLFRAVREALGSHAKHKLTGN